MKPKVEAPFQRQSTIRAEGRVLENHGWMEELQKVE